MRPKEIQISYDALTTKTCFEFEENKIEDELLTLISIPLYKYFEEIKQNNKTEYSLINIKNYFFQNGEKVLPKHFQERIEKLIKNYTFFKNYIFKDVEELISSDNELIVKIKNPNDHFIEHLKLSCITPLGKPKQYSGSYCISFASRNDI